ncbi:MAG: cryptochrome/photolyase family protein [Acidimicrobiia bacterium]
MRTIWVFGDQCNSQISSLRDADPATDRVLLVRSMRKLAGKRWHRQRLHVVLATMRRFAAELRAQGFTVDERDASSLPEGLVAHRDEYAPTEVLAMSPMSWDGVALLERTGVTVVPNNQFACSAREFAMWAGDKKRLRMEDFYRWQRQRFTILMDGDEPVDGRWNFDAENREPPPKDGRAWPGVNRYPLDAIDIAVAAELDALGDAIFGAPYDGLWPTSRAQALERLDDFIEHTLAGFGPHEDAMLMDEWKLAHSLLSSAMNLGLLHPLEVVRAAEDAYRSGVVPIASAEGFIRQVIGWREYVWGVYWHWMPEYRDARVLAGTRSVPPAFLGAPTKMRCVANVIDGIHDRAYAHHIQRLMVLGNLAMLAGVEPGAMTDWMWASFIDGAEWVMVPNVIGMAMHADGGRMATKPYAGSGSYIKKMSNACKGCAYDPSARTGERACPFTTLYWDFLARHESSLRGNHRMRNQMSMLRRLSDLDAVRAQAQTTLAALDAGTL